MSWLPRGRGQEMPGGEGDYVWRERVTNLGRSCQQQARASEGPSIPPLFPPVFLPHHPPQAGPFQSSAYLPQGLRPPPLSWVGLHSHLRLCDPGLHSWPLPVPLLSWAFPKEPHIVSPEHPHLQSNLAAHSSGNRRAQSPGRAGPGMSMSPTQAWRGPRSSGRLSLPISANDS